MGALGILRVYSFPFFSQEDGTQPWKALGKALPAVYVANVTGVRLMGRGQNFHTSPKDLDEYLSCKHRKLRCLMAQDSAFQDTTSIPTCGFAAGFIFLLTELITNVFLGLAFSA